MAGTADGARRPPAPIGRHLLGAPTDGAPRVRRLLGARLHAEDGTVWLDAATGGFGAGHPAVTDALADQLERVALSSRILLSRPLADAVTALDRYCPDPLTVSYLCNSGGEALDSALKLAKGTHPKRRRFLGFAGEDHGSLTHGLSLTLGFAGPPATPLRPDAVPADRAVELPDRIDTDVAAVVLAPAAPGRSLADLPPAWWRRVRAACTATGALLVFDERLTGPARLGTPLGAHALDVTPDALVLGETIGADAVPMGVLVTSRATYDRVYAKRNPSLHGSTFGANPLSAVAAGAVLAAVETDRLVERQRDVAAAASTQLTAIAGADRPVTAFGADGSLVWLRTVDHRTAVTLAAELSADRVLVRAPAGSVVAVLPPLTAASEDVTDLFDRVGSAVRRLGRHQEAYA